MLMSSMSTTRFYFLRSLKRNVWIVTAFTIIVLLLKIHRPGEDEDVPFATRFCALDGTCHEESDKPSPRTVYSSFTKKQYERWWDLHATLNASAAEFVARRSGKEINDRPLILLGDSITESWMGTSYGFPKQRTVGVPEILEKSLSSSNNFDPLVLAISGDQTQHLLYRLQHGELLPQYANDENALFVVMIGTNNLGSGILPGPTAKGVMAVAEYLLSNTKGSLLLFKLLPRGDGRKVLPTLCPPRCSSNGEPFRSFIPAINKVNSAIDNILPEWKQQYGINGRIIAVVDCGSKFLITETPEDNRGGEVNETLMPDLLHPNANGHEILADSILHTIKMLKLSS